MDATYTTCQACQTIYKIADYTDDCPRGCRAAIEARAAKAAKTAEDVRTAAEDVKTVARTKLADSLGEIGYIGDSLTAKVREIEAQSVASAFLAPYASATPPVVFQATKLSTVVGGVLIANLLAGLIGSIVYAIVTSAH
jgi:hypothetical protein